MLLPEWYAFDLVSGARVAALSRPALCQLHLVNFCRHGVKEAGVGELAVDVLVYRQAACTPRHTAPRDQTAHPGIWHPGIKPLTRQIPYSHEHTHARTLAHKTHTVTHAVVYHVPCTHLTQWCVIGHSRGQHAPLGVYVVGGAQQEHTGPAYSQVW